MSGIHDELHVFLNTDRIGTLSQDNGAMSFAYSTEYLRSPDAYPLSQNLPLILMSAVIVLALPLKTLGRMVKRSA